MLKYVTRLLGKIPEYIERKLPKVVSSKKYTYIVVTGEVICTAWLCWSLTHA